MDLSIALDEEEEELVTGPTSPSGMIFGSLLDGVAPISPSLHQAKQRVPVTSRIAPVMVTPWRKVPLAILKTEAEDTGHLKFHQEIGLMS